MYYLGAVTSNRPWICFYFLSSCSILTQRLVYDAWISLKSPFILKVIEKFCQISFITYPMRSLPKQVSIIYKIKPTCASFLISEAICMFYTWKIYVYADFINVLPFFMFIVDSFTDLLDNSSYMMCCLWNKSSKTFRLLRTVSLHDNGP